MMYMCMFENGGQKITLTTCSLIETGFKLDGLHGYVPACERRADIMMNVLTFK